MRIVDTEVHIEKDFDQDIRTFYGDHDEHIEEWFLNQQKNVKDLHEYLCINILKVCCPTGHYGMLCDNNKK